MINLIKKTANLPTKSFNLGHLDRCLVCGNIRVLIKYNEFFYCAVCLEKEERLDAIVEYYTDFSNPRLESEEKNFKVGFVNKAIEMFLRMNYSNF